MQARLIARARLLLPGITLKQIRYWVTALVVLGATIWAAPTINDYLRLDDARFRIFQRLTELTGGHFLEPKFAIVVMIQDDDFWDGELQHRSPTNRNYLAKLVTALAAANARAIALDFDLRLPHEEQAGTQGDYDELRNDYRDETETLIRAIDAAAQQHNIILAKTLVGETGSYRMVADAYQPYGLCNTLGSHGAWTNTGTPQFPLDADATARISCGYIALPFDKMRLPLMVDLADGRKLDSFALAIARVSSPVAVSEIDTGKYYGSFIPPKVMKDFGVTISAHDLLAGRRAARDAVNGKLVIVGSGWHERAAGFGGDNGRVDLHPSPIGKISGVVMHDNFVESILSGRISAALPEWLLTTLELLFGLGAAVLFYRFPKFPVQVAILAGLLGVLLLVQWVMLGLFYTYFDALVPLVGLAFHSIGGRILEEK